MEEDIKILEEMLKDKEQIIQYHCWIGTKSIQAIENLLKRYKELEEENKRLNTHKTIGRIDAIKIEDLEDVLKPYFIPISVIQNTLEDINKKEKEELKGLKGQDRYFVKQMYQYMRKPLQEILEKGNK